MATDDSKRVMQGFLIPLAGDQKVAFTQQVGAATNLPEVLIDIISGYTIHPAAFYSTGSAFAAVLGSGKVVTWGNAAWGGDSSIVTPYK